MPFFTLLALLKIYFIDYKREEIMKEKLSHSRKRVSKK